MNKVLVTGATGFIGRHCLPTLLANNYEVHASCTVLPVKAAGMDGVVWHQTDLLDVEQAEKLVASVKPSHLMHFAWYAVPGKYWSSSENIRWVQASLALLQSFVKHGGHRVVMAGTCAEYDWNYGYCSEKVTPLAPATLYGVCKHSLQSMMQSYMQLAGISAAWGRIFFLYGPYERPERLVSSVIRSLLLAQSTLCTHGNQIRDFLFVQDVADAFVALLNSNVNGAVNIASGQPIRLMDVIYHIADIVQQRNLVQLGAVKAPPDEPPLLVADVRRLTDEVGWHPTHTLHTGISKTIDWWKEQEFNRITSR